MIKSARRRFLAILSLVAVLSGGLAPADILISRVSSGKVAKYRNDGSLVNASFISLAGGPTGIHVSGSHIFVAAYEAGTVSRYKLDGTPAGTPFITGLSGPVGIASDGTGLYITDNTSGKVGKYNLTTGSAINANLITGLDGPEGIVVSGGTLTVAIAALDAVRNYQVGGGAPVATLGSGVWGPSGIALDPVGNRYISSRDSNKIGIYDSGLGTLDANFITTGLSNPTGLAFVQGKIAVVNSGSGKVSLHDTEGALLNGSFISGVDDAFGIAVTADNTPVPRPTATVTGSKKIVTTKASVTLKGKSTNATSVVVKLANGKTQTIKKSGAWTCTVKLKVGKNKITVTSRGPGGTSKPVNVTVTRNQKKKSAGL